MKTIVVLSVLCFILVFIVVGLLWFIRRILSKLLYVSESIGDFLIVIDNFTTHLETVNNMETYYGDETLQSLLEHSRIIMDEIEQFESIYSLTTNTDADEEYEEEEELDYDEEE
jgi:hypothetical protein